MNTQLFNVFSHQATGQKFLRVFENIAETITNEYQAGITGFIDQWGYPPSFGELIEQIKTLNDELNAHAKTILRDYREQKGHKSIKLTTGCKRIIKTHVNQYIKQLKKTLSTYKYDTLTNFELNLPGI